MNASNSLSVDINSDMGEGYGDWRMGDDAALLDIVSSANVACGFHAGDPQIMSRTFALAAQKSVNVGAHPGFPDLWGFGRRVLPCTPAEIERIVAYQIGAAQALSRHAGNPIRYVKPHGALGNLTPTHPEITRAICRAIQAADDSLWFMTFANSPAAEVAREMGLRVCHEVFADRAYADDGQLVPRSQPGAVIKDPELAAQRMLRMVTEGVIECQSGKRLEGVRIDTICIHGDTPTALEMARHLRRSLEAAGVQIRRFT
jgi:UPF0271 protein